MAMQKIGRRFFLRGVGGAALALPALPSLLSPEEARAQASQPKRMVAMMSHQGGVWQRDMFPAESMAQMPATHPLHQVHGGTLSARAEGGDHVLSPVLRAPSSLLTASLVNKMNVLRGLDVPFYYGHSEHVLGNYGPTTNIFFEITPPDNITADQVLARSTAVYPQTPRLRTLGLSEMSVEYANPSLGPAGGYRKAERLSPRALFDAIYVPPDTMPPPTETPFSAVDAIHESYSRLASGRFGEGARLGTQDRQRLELYMDTLASLRSAQSAPVAATCEDVQPIAGLPDHGVLYEPDNYRVLNDLILAAFMCDSTRVVDLSINMYEWGGFSITHDEVHAADARYGNRTEAQRLAGVLRGMHQYIFQHIVLDLVGRLDSIPEGEGTMLDNSLVWWSQEAGAATHYGDSIPVVTFGGVGGAFPTGNYVDYRNRAAPESTDEGLSGLVNEGRKPGVSFSQWTTTYLDAFGVSRNEWQTDGRVAFSNWIGGTDQSFAWDHAAMAAACDRPLPFLS